ARTPGRPRAESLRAAATARAQEGRRGSATRGPGRARDLRLAVAGRAHVDGRALDRPAPTTRGAGPGAPVPPGAAGRGDRPRAPRPDLCRDPRARQRRADGEGSAQPVYAGTSRAGMA